MLGEEESLARQARLSNQRVGSLACADRAQISGVWRGLQTGPILRILLPDGAAKRKGFACPTQGGAAMDSQLGVAVIGLGRIGQPYAQILSQLPNTRLVAVCDVALEAAERVSREEGVPGYTDVRQMLRLEPDIQAVCVCTSDPAHLEPCLAAAEAGKHILVEK